MLHDDATRRSVVGLAVRTALRCASECVGGGGRPAMNMRRVVNGIFWMLDNGATCKSVSSEFGSKSAVHRHFQCWVNEGTFGRLLREIGRMVEENDGLRLHACFVDATFSKAVGVATGSGRGKPEWCENHGPHRCARGLHVAVDTPAALTHKSKCVRPLFEFMLTRQLPDRVIGDRAQISDSLDVRLAEMGIEMIAPHQKNRRPENKFKTTVRCADTSVAPWLNVQPCGSVAAA